MSKVIRGGTVVTAERSYRADVLVEGETIAAIGEGLRGDEEVDASGAYVMPGGIDPHVHLEMPFMGTSSTDDFYTGTVAAASGGTTTVVDFCIPAPDGSMLSAWDEWAAKSKDKAVGDYAWHMCVTGWNERFFNEMEEVVRRGVNTFKHFMAYKGALMVNDDEMFASFSRCAALGALPLVHAENGDVVAALQAKLLAEGITGPEGHAFSRPPEVEGEAANRAIMIADAAGCPLYIVHVSCEQTHEAIRRARQKGMRVYGEPLAQFLVLDDSEYQHKDWVHAARRVMSPPFRGKEHQAGLWAGLAAGSLQVVATDHCAFTTEQKKRGARGLHQDPERHRRARGPDERGLDLRGRDRAADAGGVRGGDLDQLGADPEHASRRRGRSRWGRTPTSWSGTRRRARRSPRRTRSRRSTTTSSRG